MTESIWLWVGSNVFALAMLEFLWAGRWLAWLRERFKTISSKKPAK